MMGPRIPNLFPGFEPVDPRAAAWVAPGQTLDYAAFFKQITILSQQLVARGVRPGERIALIGANSLPLAAAFLAVLRCGAVAVPLNPRWPERQVVAALNSIGCRDLIRTDPLAPAPLLAGFLRRLEGWLSGANGSCAGGPLPEFRTDTMATIVFSSGSSQLPKAVALSMANHRASASGVNRALAFGRHGQWLLSLPLCHVGGMAILFRALLQGATVAGLAPEQSLASGLLALPNATHLSLVPAQLQRLLPQPELVARLRKLHAIQLGGGPLPPELVQQTVALGLPVYASYGLSEMGSSVTLANPESLRQQPSFSGRPLPDRDLSMAGNGEVLVKGETLFLGYLTPGELVPSVDAEGWFHTGDAGELDSEGNLRVNGRLDQMFVSGGENIHPEEIESHLLLFPGVVQAVVVAVPDPAYGERPVAFIQCAGSRAPEAIRAFLHARLPGFKIPDVFLPWPKGRSHQQLKPGRKKLAAIARRYLQGKSSR